MDGMGGGGSRTAYPLLPYRVPPPPPQRPVRSVSATGVMPDFFAPLGPLQQLSQKNGVFLIWDPPPSFFFPPPGTCPRF